MSETLERLMVRHGPDARGVVWAHNTHIGDARFTDMIEAGEFNLGQLAPRNAWQGRRRLAGIRVASRNRDRGPPLGRARRGHDRSAGARR